MRKNIIVSSLVFVILIAFFICFAFQVNVCSGSDFDEDFFDCFLECYSNPYCLSIPLELQYARTQYFPRYTNCPFCIQNCYPLPGLYDPPRLWDFDLYATLYGGLGGLYGGLYGRGLYGGLFDYGCYPKNGGIQCYFFH